MSMDLDSAAAQIVTYEHDIAAQKRTHKHDCKALRKELDSYGFITKLHGIKLYQDKITCDDTTLAMDSHVKAQAQLMGSISYSSEVKGGGSRPTLTRVALGSLCLGLPGAVIGACIQKPNKIQSVTHEHDTRSVVVIVSSDDGYISKTWKGADIDVAQEFVSKIMNAAVAYPHHKDQFLADKQSLATRYNKLLQDTPWMASQKALDALLETLDPKVRQDVTKLVRRARHICIVSIIGLCFSWLPIYGALLPIITCIMCARVRKRGLVHGKIETARSLSILGIIIQVCIVALCLIAKACTHQ